ncbi:hypothetical protein BOX15_Mlig030539g2, partial [Macrostomum lignano]
GLNSKNPREIRIATERATGHALLELQPKSFLPTGADMVATIAAFNDTSNVATRSAPVLPTAPGSVQACTERRWHYHLASTALAFLGGLLFLVLYRVVNRLIKLFQRRQRGRPGTGGNHHHQYEVHEQQKSLRSGSASSGGALIAPGAAATSSQQQQQQQDGVAIAPDATRTGSSVASGSSAIRDWASDLISAQSVSGRILAVLVFVLSISSAGIYIIEANQLIGSTENCTPWSRNPLSQADLAFNTVFLLFFCIRFLAAQDKFWFWLELYSVVDYCTVPPAFVSLCLSQSWLGLRFMRSLRVMTLPDVLQSVSAVKSGAIIRSLQMITIFLSVWLIGAGVTHLFENTGDPQSDYSNPNPISFGDCLYFTIVTMSTVGFGDISPKTSWGKFFISIYIMFALGIFASFIPEIAEIITSRSPYAGSYKKEHGRKHVIVCGAVTFDSIESFLSDFLHEDRHETDVEVVCINKKEPNLEFQGLLKRNFGRVVYFTGTVLSPADCQRVDLESASAVIVLGNKHTEDPDAEDASNIMRVISIKNASPTTRCIIQLLQYHNKGYLLNIPNWDWRFGDECVCLAELKQGFLAQSCLAPGFSTLMANLFSTRAMCKSVRANTWEKDYQIGSAMEIYSEYFSDSFVGMPFQDAVEVSFNKLGILLFAMEDKSDDGDRFLSINPSGRDTVIYHGCHGFFIADSQEEVRRAYLYCRKCHSDVTEPKQIKACSCTRAEDSAGAPGVDSGHCCGETHELTRLRGNSANVRRPEIQVVSNKALATLKEAEFGSEDNFGEFVEPRKESVEYFDLTGMFHWCPDKNFEDVMLTPNSVARLDLRQHYVVIVFADSDSPLIGLRSFVMPLRASNFRLNELRPIVFIGNLDFLQREWGSLKNFPKIYMFPGSPMNRVILRSAKINLCDMCVILSAKSRWKDQVDPYLMDKEVVLCTLNIKAMSFAEGLDTSVQAQLQAFQSKDAKSKSLLAKVAVPILTEIFVGKNIQFLDQEDDDADEEEIYNSQPYACGNAFTAGVLDSLMSTVFHNMNAMTLIRTLVTGGATPEMEVLMAEGLNLDGTEETPEIQANRHRCRAMQLSMLDPRLRPHEQGTFGDLFTGVFKSHGILPLGVYRYRDSYSTVELQTTKRVVITNPGSGFRLLNSDMLFCLVPFQQSS